MEDKEGMTVSDAARDATSDWRLLQCYNEVNGLAKLSARQSASAEVTSVPPSSISCGMDW